MKMMVTALFLVLATVGSGAVWAQADSGIPPFPPALVVPGFGPGVAGNISEGPSLPVCQPSVPCTRPFAGAEVLVLDSTNPDIVVGTAFTNALGNFVVSAPSGEYLVRVQVTGPFPRCGETKATVGTRAFTLVQIDCDTGIR
jgi:hypothetical protein